MRRLALALVVVHGGACGGGAAPIGGRGYDVTATLTLMPDAAQGGSWSTFPKNVAFTLAWDPGTGAAYTGGNGLFAAAQVEPADTQTFSSRGPWVANAPFTESCGGEGSVRFDQITFSLEAGALHGTATGTASYVGAGTTLSATASATLDGVPDVTAPTFTSPGPSADPLEPLAFGASEPLPETGAASLMGAPHGDAIPLAAVAIDDPATASRGFGGTGVVLRYGETYTLVTDHVTDFAGHAPAEPVTFTTRAAPPLVPEDGFESVTGTMFGGAGVLHGGPLTPLAGHTSLMLNTGFGGGFGFLPYDLGPSLAVRLAIAPGDTVIRFDSQLIAPDPVDEASFVGALRFGSVGGAVGMSRDVAGSGFMKVTLPQLGDIYVSPSKTIELPLPTGAAGEIAFEIIGETFSCNQPPSPTVLVIDNLRVE